MGIGGTGELVFRLAVAALAVAGPTILYLGLWRFLTWLRDDALIDQLAARGAVEEPRPAPADVLASATAGLDARRCSECGKRTVAGAGRCWRCRGEFDGGS